MPEQQPRAAALGDTEMELLFRASGEIGADLAKVDWSATSLGEPAAWPQSLRTILQVLLTSRFSMWMAWGKELTFFCNEKYRRDTLGAKYPWALGRPASEVWAEIWPEIGPRIESVLSEGIASWDESLMLVLERNGYEEETYHTFSYSPLTDESGEISGLLCVVNEETERVVAEARMAVLRQLGGALTATRRETELFSAVEEVLSRDLRVLPFCLLYLFDEDGRSAELAAAPGVPPGHPVAAGVLDEESPWPLGRLAAGEAVLVGELGSLFSQLPSGAWPKPPDAAMAVPLAGGPGEGAAGFLVAGLDCYRPVDAEQEDFVSLIASQISASLANARAYEAERRRAEELAELDRAKTAFFTNVSHEFRTPLTLLLGPAADAMNDAAHPLDLTQRERLGLIHRNGERLLRLVNTLLDFSRLEAGTTEPAFEPVDLAAETSEIAELFRPAVEQAGLELRLELGGLDEPVYLDREMWVKIVSNLLSNALKFTFEGEINLFLVPVGEDEERAVELQVGDTGIGISRGAQRHLFERFHRVSGARSRSFEGSGIGLALVAELVRLHGGSVRAESTLGKGSRFFVRLPLGTSHLPDQQLALAPSASLVSTEQVAAGLVEEALRWTTEESELRGGRPAGGHKRPRLLVADDNSDMRHYIAALLGEDYELTMATDGEQALSLALERPPDLVLTDVMMPGLDGFGLVAALRRDARTAQVPIIMLSARAGGEAAVEGLEAGADDYLVKPFSAVELAARIRSNLELERLRRRAGRQEHVIAAELQASLVPARRFENPTLEIAAYYQAGVSGTSVGGDWYDVIELGLGRTALVIGDVMGRGIRAAAVMGQLRAAIRAYAGMELAPADVLEAMDRTVRELEGGQIVTCIYALYDPAAGTLEYANAGHVPPLACDVTGRCHRLGEALSAPLGTGPTSIPQAVIEIEEGTTVLFYTDGLVERRDGDTDERIDAAARILAAHRGPVDELAQALVAELCPEGSDDDIAMLVVRPPLGAARWQEASRFIPSDDSGPGLARRTATEVMEAWEVPEVAADDVVLLASELVTNAVLHGRPPVELRLRQADGEIFLEVMDGAGYLPRNLRAGPSDEHGRGLRIVNALARRSGFRLTEGGKCVWATVEIDGGRESLVP